MILIKIKKKNSVNSFRILKYSVLVTAQLERVDKIKLDDLPITTSASGLIILTSGFPPGSKSEESVSQTPKTIKTKNTAKYFFTEQTKFKKRMHMAEPNNEKKMCNRKNNKQKLFN